MNNSIIEHRANYHYIQVCEEYLLICSHGKASPHCKALILSVLEQWTNTKRDSKQPLDSIYMTYPLWEQSLYYLYSRSTIIECLGELEKEQAITRTPHHTPNGKDTFAYGLAVERVQALIKALPDKGVKDLLPRLDAFKNAPRKTRVNLHASNSERETRVNLNDDASKSKRNVSSNITSSHKESVDAPTLPQPEITPTPLSDDVTPDYTTSPTIEQLSTASRQNVDKSPNENGSHSQQSYSHRQDTTPATHVGVMPVLGVPMPPGAKIPDAPQVPTPPFLTLVQKSNPEHSDEAIAIRRLYDSVHGISTGHPDWEWKKMEDMAASGVVPTREDMQLVYDHLKKTGKKHTIAHVWEAWGELPTLKKPAATPGQSSSDGEIGVSGRRRFRAPEGFGEPRQVVGGVK